MSVTIDVSLGARSYDITIACGLLERLGVIVRACAPHARTLLAVDAAIAPSHGAVAKRSLESVGYAVRVHEIVAEEDRKTLATVHELYDAMLAFRLERGSPVVALGGGVVGDVAGFAAATYLRGVPLVQAPTTLLAMVDAAIGGKTGVNLRRPADAKGRRDLGKNLVGAFWQPRAIVTDPLVLATLDDRDFRCGLAESVKHALLADASLLTFIEEQADRIAARDEPVLGELIDRSARIKVAVVEADEREAGVRMHLNLGHTFAHAIEPLPDLDLRHGEAVAIGLCAACHCAAATDRLRPSDAERVTSLLDRLGLPTRLAVAVSEDRVVEAMSYDKKVARDEVRLVLPTGLGRVEVVADVPRAAIDAAWRAVGVART